MQEEYKRDPFEEAALQKAKAEVADLHAQREKLDLKLRGANSIIQMPEDVRLSLGITQVPDIRAIEGEWAGITEQIREAQGRYTGLVAASEEKYNAWLKKKELEQPVVLNVIAVDFETDVVISNEGWRNDVRDMFRTIPGRRYVSYGTPRNIIPVAQWKNFKAEVEKLPNVSLVYVNGTAETLKFLTESPRWDIRRSGSTILAKPGPRVDRYLFSKLQSAHWQEESRVWFIPIAEAWRIPEIVKDQPDVQFDPEVVTMMVEQLATRQKLDGVAMKLSSPEYAMEFKDERKLHGFQESGLEFIDLTDGNLLLSDDPGLGKTLQAIAYAVRKNTQKNLVVCPARLKWNWWKEIHEATGETPYILSGRIPSQWLIQELMQRPKKWIIINYDIVGGKVDIPKKDKETGEVLTDAKGEPVTVPGFLWAEILNLLKPDLIIADEMHYIKNPSSLRSQAVRKLKAERIIGITGTPVINRPGEYAPGLTWIRPDLFPNMQRFINDFTDKNGGVKNPELLQDLLRPIMLRRTKKHVMPSLPDINRITKWHELSEEADRQYEDVLKGMYQELAVFDPSGKGGARKDVFGILAQIMRLKQVCAGDKVDAIAEDAQELYEATGKKVFIVSQFKGPAYNIARSIGSNTLCTVSRTKDDFVSMPGASPEFDALVRQFQSDPDVHYFVSTSGLIQEGHTLTEAWHVIFCDLLWSPQYHKQVEGRAHGRLNDAHPVDAYYYLSMRPDRGPMFSTDTIENWLWSLLAFKKQVVDESVEGVSESRGADEGSIQMQLIMKLKESLGL